MIKDCKLYECDICCRKEMVEEVGEPNDIIPFEIYNLKPCICKRCLKVIIEASKPKIINEFSKEDTQDEKM